MSNKRIKTIVEFVNDNLICCLGRPSSPTFLPPTCQTSALTGSNCNTSALLCDILKPCQNNGTCINDNTILRGYICNCSSGFYGTQCQYDNRPCRPNTCWNNDIFNKKKLIKYNIYLFVSTWMERYSLSNNDQLL
jgi:hypothetical protein